MTSASTAVADLIKSNLQERGLMGGILLGGKKKKAGAVGGRKKKAGSVGGRKKKHAGHVGGDPFPWSLSRMHPYPMQLPKLPLMPMAPMGMGIGMGIVGGKKGVAKRC